MNTPVLAMADGLVINIAGFTSDTIEAVVQHPGLGIVRYAEVDNQQRLVKFGDSVHQGQVIAYLGRRKKKGGGFAERTMLHLELYSNWDQTDVAQGQKNSLSTREDSTKEHPTFKRRMADLRNPTATLESSPLYENPVAASLNSVTYRTLSNTPAISSQLAFQSSFHLDDPFLQTILSCARIKPTKH